jgi:hypothetical protein
MGNFERENRRIRAMSKKIICITRCTSNQKDHPYIRVDIRNDDYSVSAEMSLEALATAVTGMYAEMDSLEIVNARMRDSNA